MKIIDFEKKGNVVRFYFGDDDCNDYLGDDWDDRPYEHNAGRVYDEYIKYVVDVAVPFDWSVTEPCDDWHYGGNSPFCKDDFKHRRCCILFIEPDEDRWAFECNEYSKLAGSDSNTIHKVYFGDGVEAINSFYNVKMKEFDYEPED